MMLGGSVMLDFEVDHARASAADSDFRVASFQKV